MKNAVVIILAASLMLSACQNKQKPNDDTLNAAPPAPLSQKSMIKFEENNIDFGKITEGDSILHVYKFRNVGAEALVINHASASCGCTVPEWPKDPIAPNGTGAIKVLFRSKNKSGMQNKTVSVYANTTPEVNTISFKVEVTPKAENPSK